MPDLTATDFAYQIIERAEKKRRRLEYVMGSSLLVLLFGLAANAFIFMVTSHQKGGLSEYYWIAFIMIATVCLISGAVAVRKFIILRSLGRRLRQVELMEETICREVLKHGSD